MSRYRVAAFLSRAPVVGIRTIKIARTPGNVERQTAGFRLFVDFAGRKSAHPSAPGQFRDQ